MARIQLRDIGLMSDHQQKQYERFPANLTCALLVTTASASGYLSLGRWDSLAGLCHMGPCNSRAAGFRTKYGNLHSVGTISYTPAAITRQAVQSDGHPAAETWSVGPPDLAELIDSSCARLVPRGTPLGDHLQQL